MSSTAARLAAATLAAALLFAAGTAVAAPAPAQTPDGVHTVRGGDPYCHITGSSALVRAKPNAKSAALGVVYRGAKCTGYEYDRTVNWMKVKMNKTGLTGWVHHTLVSTAREELSPTSP
ncbi:SH3 domain-containing protein [Streptomyces sp. 21So2-11]|uniref:SH3 domain-containing protein n=1 Tax=Streptomyces sp. 21So2-11 TaxID=3144408 RepID=UPI00321C0737